MSAAAFLLYGPPGSGKSHCLLDRCQSVIADGGGPLWLAPTERARGEIRSRLDLGEEPLPILTFPEFAMRLARDAQPDIAVVPESHQRLIVDDVLSDLVKKRRLGYFAPVADTRGFADAVFAFLSELQGLGISPEEFTRIAEEVAGPARPGRRRPPGDKHGEIAEVYALYRDCLAKNKLHDRAAIYALAANQLRDGGLSTFGAVRSVFLDGFIDFTPPQFALLETLTRHAEELWVTLPHPAAGDDRDEVYTRPLATLARLRELPARKFLDVQTGLNPDIRAQLPGRPAGLPHIEKQLFRAIRAVEQSSDAAGVQIIEAPGALGEVRLVTRAVKELLLSGTAAESILVTARDLGPYADLIVEVFGEYGIPIDLEATEPLGRVPVVAALLRAARLAEEDWPSAGATALLRSNYFRPDWPEAAGDAEMPLRAEMLLRMLGEPRGRDAYLNSVRKWATAPEPGYEDELAERPLRQRKHELAKRCEPFLRRFFRAWDGQPARGTAGQFTEWLRHFAAELGWPASAADVPADSAALDRFWQELDALALRERDLSARPRQFTPTEFLRRLTILLSGVGLPRTLTGQGRVRCLPAELARYLTADHVFLIGLGEGAFPDLGGVGAVFDESDRQAYREAGLDLTCAVDRLPDEMLLFHLIVTRPRKSLTLSYPAVDERGQSLLPCSFLTTITECYSDGAIPTLRRQMLIDRYVDDAPLSPAEFRVRAAASRQLDRVAAISPDLAAHLQDAAALARHRFEDREFNPFDGLLRDPAVVKKIAAEFGPQRILSPTALEDYVACPFKFYLGRVLNLQPLLDPEEEIEHTQRGTVLHRAMARFHGKLHAAGVHGPAPETAEQLSAKLTTAIEEQARRCSSPATQTLWRLEGRRLLRSAARYADHWQQHRQKWQEHGVTPRPARFEAAFGLPEPDSAEALVIRVGEIEVRIGGRIDRIDQAELADGGTAFWVIDYKTGAGGKYTAAGLTSYQRLQLSLYALAAERVLFAETGARPAGLAYWMVTDQGPKAVLPGRKTAAWLTAANDWHAFRDELESWVATLSARIRAGEFPLRPRSDTCTDTCAYGQICRIAQSRGLAKQWDLPLPGAVAED